MIRFPIAARSLSFKTRANPVMTTKIRLVLTVMVLSFTSVSPFAQSKCLSPDETKELPAQLKSPQNVVFNQKLRDNLLKTRRQDQKTCFQRRRLS